MLSRSRSFRFLAGYDVMVAAVSFILCAFHWRSTRSGEIVVPARPVVFLGFQNSGIFFRLLGGS